MTPTWPRDWSQDTPTDRARFFTRIYREAALSDDPRGSVETADRVARAFDEVWLFPVLVTGDEWITLHEFADLAGVGVEAVRQWYKRGGVSWSALPVKDRGRVRRVDVVEFLAVRDADDDQQSAA